MNEYDLHGYTVEDALSAANSYLSKHYFQEDTTVVKFITGNGKIKERLLERLPIMWDVEVREELGNSGILVVEFLGVEYA